ncbi:hypothetical protein ACIRSS_15070 [Amycolatopsis sp. NPDC101161]|uniref:hypothetical protein n=1 Tax=Amycolatopsis sp. NPDC101161 TaxID=3363940 RepID=UPI00381D3880
MADSDSIGRSLGRLPCEGTFDVRRTGPTPFEYTAAELFVREQFGPAFRARYGTIGTAVTWQLDFLFTSYEAEQHSPAIAAIFKYLRSDFTNPISTGKMAQFRKAYRDGTLTTELLADLIKFAGGFRKPDMCGITDNVDPARIELVEVGTVPTRASTRKELDDKIRQLRTQVVPFALGELRAEALAEHHSPPVRDIQVLESPWRPALRVCPLPPGTDGKGGRTHQWICYEPTFADEAGRGEDGLVIYHIHEVKAADVGSRVLPPAVLADITEAVRRHHDQRTGPQLLPELVPVWTKHQPTFDRDTMRVFAYGAAGVVGLLAVALLAAVVVPGAAAGAALAAEGAAEAGVAISRFVTGLTTATEAAASAQEAATALSGFARAALVH